MTYIRHETLPAWAQIKDDDAGTGHDDGHPQWSGSAPPPAIGARIRIIVNTPHDAVVTGYFVASGFLGVHYRQDGDQAEYGAFGTELEALPPSQEAAHVP